MLSLLFLPTAPWTTKEGLGLNLSYIKDSKISVAGYVKSVGDTEVTAFERVALG